MLNFLPYAWRQLSTKQTFPWFSQQNGFNEKSHFVTLGLVNFIYTKSAYHNTSIQLHVEEEERDHPSPKGK